MDKTVDYYSSWVGERVKGNGFIFGGISPEIWAYLANEMFSSNGNKPGGIKNSFLTGLMSSIHYTRYKESQKSHLKSIINVIERPQL